MRLLKYTDAGELTLVEAYSDIPAYAILSHVWEEDEVTYKDFLQDDSYKKKHGYQKIRNFCETARKQGIHHFWVDTVCIDKSSSAELSEAINSMFKWYQEASVCLAYLADIDSPTTLPLSRWFVRGWTLQELLAPRNVEFYDTSWAYVGSKHSLRQTLAATTGISEHILAGQSPSNASVAQRMSWAATRQTTRPEDRAYSLLGLFDIHMPLLYGEGGESAFLRLQEEILKKSDDPSIFAWRMQPAYRHSIHGLLAPSPDAFLNSRHLVPCARKGRFSSFKMTNRGLRAQALVASSACDLADAAMLGFQDCRTGASLGVYLLRTGSDSFVRTRLDQFVNPNAKYAAKSFLRPTLQKFIVPQQSLQHTVNSRSWITQSQILRRGLRSRRATPYVSVRQKAASVPSFCRDCPSRRLAQTLRMLWYI